MLQIFIFSDTDVSQGSSATHVRCGGKVNDGFVAYLLLNLSVKIIWKSVNIWRSYGQYYSGLFFDSQRTNVHSLKIFISSNHFNKDIHNRSYMDYWITTVYY